MGKFQDGKLLQSEGKYKRIKKKITEKHSTE